MKLSRPEPALPLRPAPQLGEHSVQVRREAGYSESEIAELVSKEITVVP